MNTIAKDDSNFRAWVAVIGVCLSAFMVTIDITISAAAMRDIQGSLSATLDEMSWLSTAYLMAEFIVTPLTGWLSNVFSIRRLSLISVIAFVFFSGTCGMARSLTSMITFRFFQGFFGGIFVPLASTVVLTVLPATQRAMGLLVLSTFLILGTAFGTTVGGYITAYYGWPLSYYLNVIPGTITALMVIYGMDSKPMQLGLLKKADWWGILWMAVGLMPLIFVLEEGNRLDWFSDEHILYSTIVSAIGIVLFIWTELTTKNPLVNLRLFSGRNFALANVVSFCFGTTFFSISYVLPRFLLQILGYDAFQTGLVMMWAGLPQLVISPLMTLVIKKFDLRLAIGIGFSLMIYNCFLFSKVTSVFGTDQFIYGQVLRSLAGPFVFSPIMILAFSGIGPADVPSASALVTMTRILGGSVGVGAINTLLTHRYQLHFSRIAESLSPMTSAVAERLAQMSQVLSETQATLALGAAVNREAYVMAFADSFLFLAAILSIGIVAVLFVRKPQAQSQPKSSGGGH